jgi:hypothetical protein
MFLDRFALKLKAIFGNLFHAHVEIVYKSGYKYAVSARTGTLPTTAPPGKLAAAIASYASASEAGFLNGFLTS